MLRRPVLPLLRAAVCSMQTAYLISVVNLYLGEFGFCGTGAVCALSVIGDNMDSLFL